MRPQGGWIRRICDGAGNSGRRDARVVLVVGAPPEDLPPADAEKASAVQCGSQARGIRGVTGLIGLVLTWPALGISQALSAGLHPMTPDMISQTLSAELSRLLPAESVLPCGRKT